jgi:hypothetical protein
MDKNSRAQLLEQHNINAMEAELALEEKDICRQSAGYMLMANAVQDPGSLHC